MPSMYNYANDNILPYVDADIDHVICRIEREVTDILVWFMLIVWLSPENIQSIILGNASKENPYI